METALQSLGRLSDMTEGCGLPRREEMNLILESVHSPVIDNSLKFLSCLGFWNLTQSLYSVSVSL